MTNTSGKYERTQQGNLLGCEGVAKLAMDVVDIKEKSVDNATKIKMF